MRTLLLYYIITTIQSAFHRTGHLKINELDANELSWQLFECDSRISRLESDIRDLENKRVRNSNDYPIASAYENDLRDIRRSLDDEKRLLNKLQAANKKFDKK